MTVYIHVRHSVRRRWTGQRAERNKSVFQHLFGIRRTGRVLLISPRHICVIYIWAFLEGGRRTFRKNKMPSGDFWGYEQK